MPKIKIDFFCFCFIPNGFLCMWKGTSPIKHEIGGGGGGGEDGSVATMIVAALDDGAATTTEGECGR